MKIDKAIMKIKRLRHILVICCALLITLTACSQSSTHSSSFGDISPSENSGSSGDTPSPDYNKTFGKPYSDIFQLIEEGKYGKAEDIIEEEIVGDSIKEREAENKVKEYYQLLIERFNNETLSYDDFWFVHENLCKTKFSDYADSESLELLWILDGSKSSYRKGKDFFATGNYADAVGWLSNVSSLDSNYSATIDMISDIAVALGNSESLQELKRAVFACDILHSRRAAANGGDWTILYRDNIITDESCIEIKLRFAQRLEEQKQYRYAIQQYAQLIIDYSYYCDVDLNAGTSSDTPANEGYCRLMRMLNSKCYTDDGYYYIGELNSEGRLNRSDHAVWNIRSSGYLQVASWVADGGGGLYERILITIDWPRPGNSFSSADSLWTEAQGSTYATSDTLAVADRIANTGGITKVVTKSYDGVAALLYDGTVRYFSLENKYNEVESWYQIIDLWRLSDGFVGLTDSGRIVATSDLISKYPALAEALTWENIVSVSFGFENDGHVVPHTYQSLYALCDDGTIKYIKEFDNKGYSSSGVVQANAVAIAGSYYLESEGHLRTCLDSLESEVDRWSGNKFTDIISPCGSERQTRSDLDYTVIVHDASFGIHFELPNVGMR